MVERQVDYHVHYYLDRCASPDMTLPKIDAYAHSIGLDEITVLKHYSHRLPNGQAHWANWHQIVPEEFSQYLSDVHNYKSPYGTIIHTGVEAELNNTNGDINIPEADQEKIDMVALSMHFMIDMPFLPLDATCYPPNSTEKDKEWLESWDQKVKKCGAEAIVAGIVEANCNAIRRFPKVRTLSHLYDGLYMLRDYRVPVEDIPDDRLLELMEPLMLTMASHNVYWELLGDRIPRPTVLYRAKELGVRFVPTGDAHYLENHSWGNFSSHLSAQKLLDDMRLPNGYIRF